MVQLPGKRNRRVPLLITPDVKSAMEVLVRNRRYSGIPDNNPYFFASNSPTGYLDHWRVLKDLAEAAQLDHPELVTSTALRKYISTVAQVHFLMIFSLPPPLHHPLLVLYPSCS
jgi:hypothetical protein